MCTFFNLKRWEDYLTYFSSMVRPLMRVLTSRLLHFIIVPEACRELKADSAGSETIKLNWQPPETDAGITKYKVMCSLPELRRCGLNEQHHWKILFCSCYLNGHTSGFDPETQKLELPCTAQ